MARRDLVEMYCAPAEYLPPSDKDFIGSTQYPNLNSEEYRRKFSLITNKAPEFYEFITCNGKQQVLVVCNDYRRRLWSGKFQLFSNISAFKDKQPVLAEHDSRSPISTITYLSNDKVLFGTATGGLELWEVQPSAKSDSLGIYKVDTKEAHLDVLSKVELFAPKDSLKFVTGGFDGSLKLWALDNREMMNSSTYHGAHSYAITDLSVHPEEELFVSVSRDKSALLWDHRQVRPATGLLEDHPYHLTACNWRGNVENADIVVVGDAKGDLLWLDIRVPNKIVAHAKDVFERPVRKILKSRTKDEWLVCGNSTELKRVTRAEDGQSVGAESVLSCEDWVRDLLVESASGGEGEEKDSIYALTMTGDLQVSEGLEG